MRTKPVINYVSQEELDEIELIARLKGDYLYIDGMTAVVCYDSGMNLKSMDEVRLMVESNPEWSIADIDTALALRQSRFLEDDPGVWHTYDFTGSGTLVGRYRLFLVKWYDVDEGKLEQ